MGGEGVASRVTVVSPGPVVPEPSAEKIAAVVVTYHPDKSFPERLARTACQVHKIIIVDNCSNGYAVAMLRRTGSSTSVELIENNKNLGIAAALNQGVQRAVAQGYSWVLTLDQDSKPEPEMVRELISTYMHSPARKVAVVAPIPVDEASGRAELTGLCNGEKSVEIKIALTSGSLMPTSTFALVGPFREDFFIDYVDAEYCLRLRKAGYSVILSCDARLLHNLGSPTLRRFMWKPSVVTSNHSPQRRYYITRNRLLLVKEYALREPSWTANELRELAKDAAKVLLFEKDRREKTRFLLRGAIDALLNRTGELSGQWTSGGSSGKSTSGGL